MAVFLTGGFLQDIDKVGGGGFHTVGGLVDLRVQITKAQVGDDTDDKAGSRGDHLDVDATGDGRKGIIARRCQGIEQLEHPDDGSEESEQRADIADDVEDREVPFHMVEFQLRDIFHRAFDGVDGFADALDAFIDHSGNGVIGVLGQAPGGLDIAVDDMVADNAHEIVVGLRSLSDRDIAFEENEDGDHQQNSEGNHQDTALHEDIKKVFFLCGCQLGGSFQAVFNLCRVDDNLQKK